MAADAGRRGPTTPSAPPAGPSTRPAGPPTWACGCGACASSRRPFAAHAEEMRALTIAEAGSPVLFTYSAQLDDPVASLGWVADWPRPTSGRPTSGRPSRWGCPSQRWVRREATGVVGAITPWNVPHQINLAKLGPALAAGNTVVLKPAPDTPWCATVLGAADRRGDRHPRRGGQHRALVGPRHRRPARRRPPGRPGQLHRFDRHRRSVMAPAPEPLKRVFLELGGKSAFVVLDDAELRGACGTAAFTVCAHAGQGCAITTRLVVPRRHFDEAVESTGPRPGQAAGRGPHRPGDHLRPAHQRPPARPGRGLHPPGRRRGRARS